jgi:hypothetical protein
MLENSKSLKIKNLTGTKFVLQESHSLYIEFSQVDKVTLILLCRRNSLPFFDKKAIKQFFIFMVQKTLREGDYKSECEKWQPNGHRKHSA